MDRAAVAVLEHWLLSPSKEQRRESGSGSRNRSIGRRIFGYFKRSFCCLLAADEVENIEDTRNHAVADAASASTEIVQSTTSSSDL